MKWPEICKRPQPQTNLTFKTIALAEIISVRVFFLINAKIMNKISEPTLLLDPDICKSNIRRMADKARKNELKFKPHMKTHQSAEVGRWMSDAGVVAITVSSVKMAEYFANHGWEDITIAFPCNLRLIDKIGKLAESISLTLLVNRISTAERLEKELANKVKAYIEIDSGSHRTGLQVNQIPEIKKLISHLSNASHIEWIGFYSHPGHSYSARSKKEIQQVHQSVTNQFQDLRTELEPNFGKFEICIGDTPCCTVGTDFTGIDAMSPGNFVFFDLMQHQIGSCEINDIAVAMACPIVDKYPERNELAIHGGAIHFSKEALDEQDLTNYGKVATKSGNHWQIEDDNSYLKSLSQEHGIVKCSDEIFDSYEIGNLILILPIHSCLTANLMKKYQLDDGQIINQLK